MIPYFLTLLSCLTFYSMAQSIPARILIYSATAGFRHDSIPTAIEVLKDAGTSINVEFDATEDMAQFTNTTLRNYDALLFLSTTGEVLDNEGKQALQDYLNMGGNFVGVHSASDCLVNTTFYGLEVGAFFDYHADLQDAIVDVLDPSHPSTSMIPTAWKVRDEMYNFKSDPRAIGATVLLAANESSYVDNGIRKFDQGTPHPIAWYQTKGRGAENVGNSTVGRSFYTSLGHLNETWRNELFISHVLGGVFWTLQGNTTRAMNPSAVVGNTQGQGNLGAGSNMSTSTGTGEDQHGQPSDASSTFKFTIVAATLLAVIVGFGPLT